MAVNFVIAFETVGRGSDMCIYPTFAAGRLKGFQTACRKWWLKRGRHLFS